MKFKNILLLIISILTITSSLNAYWVWTPETKKWTNPKWDTKDTPREQFKWARDFYKQKKYKKAMKEFRKLISKFETSSYAAESQYYIGKCLMDMKKYYDAYLAYQKGVEKYPGTSRIEEILDNQMKIANHYYHKETKKIAGIKVTKSYEFCIEIYTQVVKNAPYSKFADQAQFFLAESYRQAGKFDEAIKAYNKLIETYPESKFFVESRYKVALCRAHNNTDPSRDNTRANVAIKEFEDFTKKHGDSSRVEEAKEQMNELLEKKAKELFETALFYEKQGKHKAALVYYEELYNKYSKTSYSDRARVKINKLKKKI